MYICIDISFMIVMNMSNEISLGWRSISQFVHLTTHFSVWSIPISYHTTQLSAKTVINYHKLHVFRHFSWAHPKKKRKKHIAAAVRYQWCPFGKNRGAGLVYHPIVICLLLKGFLQTPLLINQPMGKGHLWLSLAKLVYKSNNYAF